jgi:hypothetical protein
MVGLLRDGTVDVGVPPVRLLGEPGRKMLCVPETLVQRMSRASV